ncbi:MAG: 1-deoxy-D-xylulose-5-phosphate synthase [Gammaproteobacteria bacterium]|nr:1-deoxy-D-xylulose-5-phosphate synthase [Gammaproteobacteria bacterium]
MNSPYPLLDRVNSPADLRQFSESELLQLADELRQHLIETVSSCGGHFGAGLGTIELTIALHYVFDTPDDRLVWDVGHQSYPHKVLTGRRDQLGSIRKKGGLTPFPKRAESEYDNFGVGHSSTSIGAALGMAVAGAQQGLNRKYIAVIGDGAMSAGMAFEALNHCGDIQADLLTVLNDNEMSISPNVGALSKYFTRILSGKTYSSMRENSKKVLEMVPPMWEIAKRAEEHVKGMVAPGTLFEELDISYYGPIDGHDLPTLIKTLQNLKEHKGPRLLHIITKKGKGYSPAELNPVTYHGVSPFDPGTGITKGGAASSPTYTQVFGDWLCDMASQDSKLIGITPAMREGSGLVAFSQQFPDRYYDVAIAEQHALIFAAGLACDGMKPVVAIYSTFLQRAYDQLAHDIDLQNLNVLFAIDRAGVVGPDGPTHAGTFDYSFMRCLPNMVIMAPANENECRQMLTTGFQHDGPAAVRYPRGKGPGVQVDNELQTLPVGKAETVRHGRSLAILAFGTMVSAARRAADKLDATLINMRFVKPLDEALIRELAGSHELLVTIEENSIMGGAGSAVAEFLNQEGLQIPLVQHGLPDRYIEHAEREEQLAECLLDPDGIETFLEKYHTGSIAKSAAL